MNFLFKTLNQIVIRALGPVHVARDTWAKKSHMLSYLFRQFTRILNGLYRTSKQTKNDFQRSPYGVWLKERKDDTFTYCMRGEYGYQYSQHLRKMSTPFVYIDIGANIGLYSIIALENPHAVMVHAFDPDSSSIEFLQANLEQTKLKNWKIHPVAISNVAGTMTLNKKPGHSGASTIEQPTFENVNQETIEVVDYEYLDSVFTNTDQRFVIKIDVEGHEISVLETLAKTKFFNQISEIFAEFDTRMSDPRLTEEWFNSHGFVKSLHLGDDSHWDALYVKK